MMIRSWRADVKAVMAAAGSDFRNGGNIMKIYNTLTKSKDEFVPLEPGKVKMYVCLPNGVQLHSYWKCKTYDCV